MLTCPLIEAELLDERRFDETPESNVTQNSSAELSSEFPWLGAAASGDEGYEFTKNLGGNNGTSTSTVRK